jgi:DNA-binding transcriptional regulator GbsR (MarR family)
MWTLMLLSPSPLSAQDFMEKLDISKALASISINRLLKYEVILISHIKARGKTYYEVNPDITSVIKNVLINREKTLLDNVNLAAKELMLATNQQKNSFDYERAKYIFDLSKTGQKILNSVISKKATVIKFLFNSIPPKKR